MASISAHLQKIMSAVYGEEVRSSIHDAIKAMNEESSNAIQYASTAKDSAQASAASAQENADSVMQKAGEASASAKAAKASEANAKTFADNAAERAAAAAGSKTAAANSEAIAVQKASEAADSQSAAAQSAAEVRTVEQWAKIFQSDMETLGAQMETAKADTETAKEAAQAAQEAAVIHETNAQNFAKTALTAVSATEAARDNAVTAKTAAETARAAAETAQSDAERSKIVSESARDAAAENADAAAKSAVSARQYSGKPPKPLDGTWWIWDAEKQAYTDSKISCELVGPVGTGIEDIQLSSGSHSPGTTDIYTVKLTNGTSYNISVYNGRNGTGAGDVLGIWFDLVIPASGWNNGKITIEDSHLLALATHKYFLRAEEACREEFLECNVQPKDITETGFLTFTSDTDPAMDLTVNLIRLELAANGTA